MSTKIPETELRIASAKVIETQWQIVDGARRDGGRQVEEFARHAHTLAQGTEDLLAEMNQAREALALQGMETAAALIRAESKIEGLRNDVRQAERAHEEKATLAANLVHENGDLIAENQRIKRAAVTAMRVPEQMEPALGAMAKQINGWEAEAVKWQRATDESEARCKVLAQEIEDLKRADTELATLRKTSPDD